MCHTLVVFDNKIWLFGGTTDRQTKGDVWNSANGREWQCITDSAGWKRFGHSSVVWDEKMWVIGGFDANGSCNDAWYSRDGKQWSQVKEKAAWIERSFHTTVVHENKIWLIGGQDDDAKTHNDIWSSAVITPIKHTHPAQSDTQKYFIIKSVFPNPFSSHIVFSYQVQVPTSFQVRIYTNSGRLVYARDLGMHQKGIRSFAWDGFNQRGKAVEAGVYCVCIQTSQRWVNTNAKSSMKTLVVRLK